MNEKTRCGKRWTEARFKSFVTSALRGAFRRWGPKSDVLKNAFTRVKKNKASGRSAKHYRCNLCKRECPYSAMSVDHSPPIGSFISWDVFVEKLFCEKDQLQAICRVCHKKKSKQEAQQRTKTKKERAS